MYVSHENCTFAFYHDYNTANADTHKSRSIIISAISFPHLTLSFARGHIKMDSETKISDFSSDSSTQILPDNTLREHNTELHNKISIIKENVKIELESKGTVSPCGNILYFSSVNQPWLDIVEKLCSK